jgi:branched-chain amino acid transport system permease protein
MVGMFIMLTAFVFMKLPFLVALLVSVLASALIGMLMGRLVVKPLLGKDLHVIVVATIGVSIILSNGAKLIWGTQPFYFPAIFQTQPMKLGVLSLSPQSLWIIGITLTLVVALQLGSQRTRLGKAMRAVSQDREMSVLVGISTDRMTDLTIALSTGLAATAGVLLAPIVFVAADIGIPLLLRAFIAAVLGGFGSYTGALLGGLLIGVVDNLTAFYVSSAYRDVISFTLLVIVLAIRPTGLLGTVKL